MDVSKSSLPEREINLTLSRLEKIILETLDYNQVVQKVDDSVLNELKNHGYGYRIVVLALIDENAGILKRVSVSQTAEAKEALSRLTVPLSGIDIPLNAGDNYCIKTISEGKRFLTNDWKDILCPPFTSEQAREAQQTAKIKSSIIYPLMVRNKAIGIMIFSTANKKNETDLFEDELLTRFTGVVALAVQNARLYTKVENTSKELQTLNDKLKALDKQKDEFISMAAHELRAPLTAIKGYVSMIMDGDAGAVTDQTKDYLTDVASVNDRLVRLVNNMLNVGRIEEGRLIYKIEVVRLRDIVDSVFKSFRFEAERKSLKFTVDMDESIKDTVEVDGDRLNEVVGNFVSNAIKYTDSGEIVIHLTQPEVGMVRLAVKDTGPGVSKKEQEKLFQKFFRVESTAGKTIGTGLGLYISKLLINKFGGQIGINSEAGKGSEFWFTLPTTEKPLGEVREEKSEPMQTQPTQEAAAQDDK